MSNMKIITLEVAGLPSAILGMRNPMTSWSNSDSDSDGVVFTLGVDDKRVATNLVKAGASHCKFLRQVQVWANFTMPRYWWSEFDTYHFNTKNSCSTMHRILTDEIEIGFFVPPLTSHGLSSLEQTITDINAIREAYLRKELTKDEATVEIKRLLPESFLQMRTVNTNYYELMNAYHQRKNHRLKEEWQDTFCRWCETLPYFKELCIDPVKETK